MANFKEFLDGILRILLKKITDFGERKDEKNFKHPQFQIPNIDLIHVWDIKRGKIHGGYHRCTSTTATPSSERSNLSILQMLYKKFCEKRYYFAFDGCSIGFVNMNVNVSSCTKIKRNRETKQ